VSLEEKEWLTLTEHTSSPPFNICISRYRVFYFVKSLVFTFFCSCCDVCYDFRIKTMFGLVFTLSCFINVILYLFTYTNVQYDFHNRRRLCSLTFYVVFCRSLFVLFPLTIMLSVLLRLMDSEYPYQVSSNSSYWSSCCSVLNFLHTVVYINVCRFFLIPLAIMLSILH
jgi:hypothetical protein